jgi:hypothetical protein
MPVPIIYLDGQLRHFAEQFRQGFSKVEQGSSGRPSLSGVAASGGR